MGTARDTESKISDMGAWDFWAHPRSLGFSEKDSAAFFNGTADSLQRARAEWAGAVAKSALIMAEAGQPFGKPS